jgi:virginiamycin B lyase
MAKGCTSWLAFARGFALTLIILLGWPAYAGAQTITIFNGTPGNVAANSSGFGISAGPDGALWYTGGGIGRITTSGTFTGTVNLLGRVSRMRATGSGH